MSVLLRILIRHLRVETIALAVGLQIFFRLFYLSEGKIGQCY